MPTTLSGPDVGLWYARYGTSLRSLAARVTGDPDDADDALHETFLAAWRFRDRFDARRDPLPWLVTIARRKAVTIVSGRRRVPLQDVPAQTSPSAEEQALHRESDAAVRRLVNGEPALALHALDGMPARMVGERLGVPLRTAASRIARGRRRLRAALPETTFRPARSKAPWSISS